MLQNKSPRIRGTHLVKTPSNSRINWQAFSELLLASGPALDLHFGNITISELGALVKKRRVVAHNVVNGDASGESNTTLQVLALLASVGLLDLLLDHGVDGGANGGDIGADHAELRSLLEAV